MANEIREIVFATNNAHKLEEVKQMAGEDYKILSLADIGYHQDIPETGNTLEENSLIKAREIWRFCGKDCFADDTGLLVDALHGAPGVLSARYAGEHCSPEDNIVLLLKNLEGEKRRAARFRTIITFISEGIEKQFSGSVEGFIAEKRYGVSGFGYDPIFIAAETGRTFASMTPEQKNAISHRGRAMQNFFSWLRLQPTSNNLSKSDSINES